MRPDFAEPGCETEPAHSQPASGRRLTRGGVFLCGESAVQPVEAASWMSRLRR